MNTIKPVLVLDWSALIKNRLFSLLSGYEPITRATDIDEVRYRVAKMVFELIDLVDPELIVIAKDNKLGQKRNYWRSGYLAQYYRRNTEQLTSLSDITHYVRYDNSTYPYDGTKVTGKKITKKDMPKDLEVVTNWDTSIVDNFAPTYKGNRKNSEWVFETSKEDFDLAFNQMAIDIAGITKVKIVDATMAEADDIAGVLCLKSTRPHVLATIDGDWYQLAMQDHVDVINLTTMNYIDQTKDEIARDLQIKYVMGDSGDGIKSTWIDGKSVNNGQKKATEIVDAGDMDTVNAPALERNVKLIRLDLNTIPKIVQRNIITELKTKVKYDTCTWADMGLPPREQAILTNSGSTLTKKHSPSPIAPKGDTGAGLLDDDLLPF